MRQSIPTVQHTAATSAMHHRRDALAPLLPAMCRTLPFPAMSVTPRHLAVLLRLPQDTHRVIDVHRGLIPRLTTAFHLKESRVGVLHFPLPCFVECMTPTRACSYQSQDPHMTSIQASPMVLQNQLGLEIPLSRSRGMAFRLAPVAKCHPPQPGKALYPRAV